METLHHHFVSYEDVASTLGIRRPVLSHVLTVCRPSLPSVRCRAPGNEPGTRSRTFLALEPAILWLRTVVADFDADLKDDLRSRAVSIVPGPREVML